MLNTRKTFLVYDNTEINPEDIKLGMQIKLTERDGTLVGNYDVLSDSYITTEGVYGFKCKIARCLKIKVQ